MEIDEVDRFDLTGQVLMPAFSVPAESGSYSLIYRGIWGGNPVAVKVIKSVTALRAMRRVKVRRERTVWEALEHPNILPFYGHADDEHFGPFGAFISPWCFNGDVGRFLGENGSRMEVVERVELWKGVLSGVAFLHGRGPVIVHGDLKPGNVLIDNNRCPRICDFGLARIIQEAGASGMTTTTEHTGTERYLAPELVATGSAKPTTASDVYALGCLGLDFIYLERPYAHQENNHHGCIIIDIRDWMAPATRQEDIHSPLDFWWGNLCSWELIEALWYQDPEGRPAAVSVMRHLDTPNLGFDDANIVGGVDELVYYSPLDQAGESIYHEERHENALQLAHTAETLPQFGSLLNHVASGIPDISQQSTPSSHPSHTSLHATIYVDSHMSPSSGIDETSNPPQSPDRIASPYNDETISNRAVILTPDGHSDRPSRLNSLGTALHSRFTRRGEPADVEEAISMLQQAVDLTSDGDPDKSSRLSDLGAALHSRFTRRGELVDIEKAVSIQQQAVELTPDDHPDKSSRLSNLGIVLHSRFILRGELADIEGAILNLQKAVELTDHPYKSNRLSNLELALFSRSMRCDGHADVGRPSESINSQLISRQRAAPTIQYGPRALEVSQSRFTRHPRLASRAIERQLSPVLASTLTSQDGLATLGRASLPI